MYHLLFEQSGTFKNELIKLGYEARDYDILNDFNQTDEVVDIFKEIEKAVEGGQSIFDGFNASDTIIAFFPCTRFEDQNILNVKGLNSGMKKWDMVRKLEYSIEKVEEMSKFYKVISKLVIVCIQRRIPLIIENPYSTQHFLTRYWPLKPALIDKDRRTNGDSYKKPTQYWFINCNPKMNILFEPIQEVKFKTIETEQNQVERSMIQPQYANRFLRQYVLPKNKNDLNVFTIGEEQCEM